MIRKLLLTTTAFVALSGAALAADLPMRAPVLEAPPVFTWTGFYIGSTVGGMTLEQKYSCSSTNYGCGGYNSYSESYTNSTVTVGGTVGYNYQISSIVLGLEADYNWANIRDTSNYGSGDYGMKMSGFGTVRGRLGLAWDRALLYVTGGFAFSDLKQSGYGYSNSYSNNDSSDWSTGWTIGTGVEYAIAPHVSIKLEGLYMDLGKKSAATLCGDGFAKLKNTATVGRVGLNYKF